MACVVDDVRALQVTLHSARKAPYNAIDVRTTRDLCYQVSERKLKLRHRGGALGDWIVAFAVAAYNLVRFCSLVSTCP